MADLRTIWIETKEGSIYLLPDVDMKDFVLMFGAKADTETLTLVNTSNALLMLPIRIVKEVWSVGNLPSEEEVLWTSSSA